MLRVRPEAEQDMFEAALWYEGERAGLGARFLDSVRRVFLRIQEAPEQFPVVAEDIRRALVGRFPFGVFFFAESETSTVIAVTHLHRHPSSWEQRR